MDDQRCIGILGYGNMGRAASQAFLENGYAVYVWNRTFEKIAGERGIIPVKRIRELTDLCRNILVIVSDDDASANVILGEDGIFRYNREKMLVINSTTISPLHSMIISREAQELGIKYVNAPIMGGPKTLLNRKNLIISDGEKDAFEDAKDILSVISEEVLYVGNPPIASVIKLILNSVALINAQALSEALALAEAWDLDLDLLAEAASRTWIKPIFDKYFKRVLDKEYPTSFRMRLAAKDLFYAEAAGYYKDQPLPLISTSMRSYLEASRKGYGDKDYTRIYYFLRGRSK